jgi:hypothetical protein
MTRMAIHIEFNVNQSRPTNEQEKLLLGCVRTALQSASLLKETKATLAVESICFVPLRIQARKL